MNFVLEHLAKKIKGRRYICRVCCSTDPQAETSIPVQLEELHQLADSCGGTAAGNDIVLPGVSASKPANVDDLIEAIKRKKELNDFDVILSLVADRWSRGGAKFAFWAEVELWRSGIELVNVRSNVPEGPHAATIESMEYESARDSVKSTSLRSVLGRQHALKSNKICTSHHTPYGLYRMYLSADGIPLHILRDMRDGTQQKLHPQTRERLEVYGIVGGGSSGHYRKQKSEQVHLVSGDEKEKSCIRLIFQRRWAEGRGGRRIFNELNALGILAPEGGRWTQRQVDVIAENPIYCGWGIANLSTAAIFHSGSNQGITPVEYNPITLATKENMPVKLQHPDHWIIRQEPYLQDYLPKAVKDVASVQIKALWERRARGESKPHILNTHMTSLYILTGIARALPDRELLVSMNCGPRNKTVRYYGHPIARKDPAAAGFPNTMFRADVLEQAIMAALVETLQAMPDLRDELRLAVEAAMNARKPKSPATIGDLQRKLSAVKTQIKITFDVASADTQDEAKAKIAELGQQRRELEEQLRLVKDDQHAVINVDSVVESLVQRLGNLSHELESLPVYQLRQVLVALTDGLTAHMLTREVVMTLRVPETAIFDAETAIPELCLRQNSGSSTVSQTQLAPQPVLATIRCEYERVAQKQCYRCSRIRKAA